MAEVDPSGELTNNMIEEDLRLPRTATVFVCRLSAETVDAELKELFDRNVGDVVQCSVFRDSVGSSKGCASVEFASREAAGRALALSVVSQRSATRAASFGAGGNKGDDGDSCGKLWLHGRVVICREAVERGRHGGGDSRPPIEISPDAALGPRNFNTDFKKVFVAGLDWATTDDKLEDKFSECGRVLRATVFRDRQTGSSKGCGLVEFDSPRGASSAVEMFHETQEWRGSRPEGAQNETEQQEEQTVDDEELLRGPASREKRVDPGDGKLRTYPELKDKYTGQFKPQEVKDYWLRDCKPPRSDNGYSGGGAFGGADDPSGTGNDPNW